MMKRMPGNSGYDSGKLERYHALHDGRNWWEPGTIPVHLQDETLENAAFRLGLPVPAILADLYEMHAGATHPVFGTLIHPAALQPVSEIPELIETIALGQPHLVLPILNLDDDYLCLDFRSSARASGGETSLRSEPTVILVSPNLPAPGLVYRNVAEMLTRMGMPVPA